MLLGIAHTMLQSNIFWLFVTQMKDLIFFNTMFAGTKKKMFGYLGYLITILIIEGALWSNPTFIWHQNRLGLVFSLWFQCLRWHFLRIFFWFFSQLMLFKKTWEQTHCTVPTVWYFFVMLFNYPCILCI